MNKKMIARENVMFFVTVVGMSLGIEYFARAVLDSSREISQFSTDMIGAPGYIRIDSSVIRKKGEKYWDALVEKIRGGFLTRISYEFSSATEFKGELNEQVTFEKEGCVFSFYIKQYERDSAHGFEIINPEDLGNIPENEKLGRVVYLTITL